jgi:hypothetical protein
MSPLEESDLVPLADAKCVYCAVPIEGHRVVYMCRPYFEAVQTIAREKERADIVEFLRNEADREGVRVQGMTLDRNHVAADLAEERQIALVRAADNIVSEEHLT